jgi:hypothetical protein
MISSLLLDINLSLFSNFCTLDDMQRYTTMALYVLSDGPILVIEDVNISFFLCLTLIDHWIEGGPHHQSKQSYAPMQI